MTYTEIFASPQAVSYRSAFNKIRRYCKGSGLIAPAELNDAYHLAMYEYRLYLEQVVNPAVAEQKKKYTITGKNGDESVPKMFTRVFPPSV